MKTEFTSPKQKRIVSIIENPRRLLIVMAVKIVRGRFTAASSISSAMWTLVSAPGKVATLPMKPTY